MDKVNTLEVLHLEKYFGKRKVVNDISFSMQSGEITGLLGPNGADRKSVV